MADSDGRFCNKTTVALYDFNEDETTTVFLFTSVISYKSNGIESLVDLMSNFYSGVEASVVDDIVAAIQYQIVNTRQVVDK